MKKLLCVLLSFLMVASIFVGCGGNTTSTTTPQNTSGNDATGGNNDATGGNETTEPEEPVELVIGIMESVVVTDYEDNALTKWLEETCNVKLKFKKYASSSADLLKQLSTETVSGQKLPDILFKFRLGSDLIDQYGEDGFLLDLTDYFEDREKSANFWELFENEEYFPESEQYRMWWSLHSENRASVDGEVSMDGPIYAFPSIELSLVDTMNFMPMINQTWLDNLHLEAPTTLDELVTVLRAFKEQDANGNGYTVDEVPMLGTASHIIPWLINFFIYHDDAYHFNIDENGKLYVPYDQDAYREALKFIRGLINEGLLHVKSLTYRNEDTKVLVDGTDSVGVTAGHPSIIFSATGDRITKWTALNVLGNVYYDDTLMFRDVFITTDCENPDKAWEVLMALCTMEGGCRLRYGEKGVDWDWADEGAVSNMGIPAIIKIYNDIWNVTGNQNWHTVTGSVALYTENEAVQADENTSAVIKHKYDLLADLRNNYDAALAANVNKDLVCPWLRFSEDENEMAPQRAYLKEEVENWRGKFLTGEKNINSDVDWAEYLQVLDNLGIEEYLLAGQRCYERMYKS